MVLERVQHVKDQVAQSFRIIRSRRLGDINWETKGQAYLESAAPLRDELFHRNEFLSAVVASNGLACHQTFGSTIDCTQGRVGTREAHHTSRFHCWIG